MSACATDLSMISSDSTDHRHQHSPLLLHLPRSSTALTWQLRQLTSIVLGVSTTLGRQQGFRLHHRSQTPSGPSVVSTDLSCSRTTHPDTVLGGSTDLRGQRRTPTSIWPPVAARPLDNSMTLGCNNSFLCLSLGTHIICPPSYLPEVELSAGSGSTCDSLTNLAKLIS